MSESYGMYPYVWSTPGLLKKQFFLDIICFGITVRMCDITLGILNMKTQAHVDGSEYGGGNILE